ncbi:hypothetical protein, partial [Flavobacterium sp. W22_SRS_FP1]|uniref:hypothetical protein n=1 Tax=Flavobacterium sp. W22_SRS_FP1 TaxID=3240276 RepID=UPI003F8FD1A9
MGNKALSKIKKVLNQRDYGQIDIGIELIRSLDQPDLFEDLLEGCKINENGEIIKNKFFSGTKPTQPYLDYSILTLINFAPDKANLDVSLIVKNIKKLKLDHFDNLNSLTNFINLTELKHGDFYKNRYYRHAITNLEGLINCTNLTVLEFDTSLGMRNLTNLDGLINCSKLTKLNVQYCDELTNLDGIANCLNLT